MVTRQRERDQDKGSWYEGEVWGRCECRQGEVGRRHREDEEQTPADTESGGGDREKEGQGGKVGKGRARQREIQHTEKDLEKQRH